MPLVANTTSNSYRWGPISLYCIFTSMSSVWVSTSFTHISGSILTFFTILIAQIIFYLLSLAKKEKVNIFIKNNFKKILWLNIFTVTSWFFMFMALQRIEASVESAIYQGWIPVVVTLIALHSGRVEKKNILGPAFIAISIFFLVTVRIYIQQDNATTDLDRVIEGIILASVAGATGGIYLYLSGNLKNIKEATTMNILATRFVLLLIVTASLSYNQFIDIFLSDFVVILKLIILSILFVVIPIFCLQHATMELGVFRVSIITPLVPVIALSVEYIVSPWQSIWVPILIGIVSCSLIISNLSMSKKPK